MGGLTWFTPGEDPSLISKQQIFARIVGALGGRAAEIVVFGEDEVTWGASGDLQQVSNMAKQMVTTYGMSDIGPWSLQDQGAQSQDMIMRMMSRNNTSVEILCEKETMSGDEFRAILGEYVTIPEENIAAA